MLNVGECAHGTKDVTLETFDTNLIIS